MANSEEEDKKPIHVPFLVQIYGENVNKKYILKGHVMNIGRHPKSHIKIDSINVSRNHCTLCYVDEKWTLKDNDSQNGTYVNGRRLKKNQIAALEIGDIIFLGPPSENPQAFTYDDYLDEREHILWMASNSDDEKESLKENNTQSNTECSALNQASVEAQSAEIKNSQEESNKRNILASNSNKNRIKLSDASEPMDTSDEKNLQRKTKKQGQSKLEHNGCVQSTSQKLPSKVKSHADENENLGDQVQIEDNSESLLDGESDNMCDPELYSYSQKVGDSDAEDNTVSKKMGDGVSQTKRHSDNNDSEILKAKLALLSEEVKQLEKSKSELLKEYESVQIKNKMLDDALVEQIRLKEEMQMCEQRVKNKFKNQIMEKLEEELICNICTEVLIKPTVLDCSHTFCEHCIKEWKKKKRECPICRNKILSMTRVLALDHFIDKTLETFTPGQKEKRNELELQRHQSKNKPTANPRRKKRRISVYSTYRRSPVRAPNRSVNNQILTEIRNNVVPVSGPVRVPISSENIEIIEIGDNVVPLPSESIEVVTENDVSVPIITVSTENTPTTSTYFWESENGVGSNSPINFMHSYVGYCYNCGMYDHEPYLCPSMF